MKRWTGSNKSLQSTYGPRSARGADAAQLDRDAAQKIERWPKHRRRGTFTAIDNKRLMQNVFSEMADGNLEPFIDTMAEEMRWTWMGTGRWSRTFEGKESVVNELFAAVKETLSDSFEVIPHRFIAEGDFVVIEHSGRNTTRDGRPYNNNYCWVCRFANGKLHELREYMDTELVTKTFGTEAAT